jgi:anti-sigma B factor antagonist
LQITSAGEGSIVLSVVGEIDLSTADELQAALDGALKDAGTTEVCVDLSDVGFLDSAGLRVLVSSLRAAEERKLGFRVTGAQPRVRKVIEITGLTATLGLDAG